MASITLRPETLAAAGLLGFTGLNVGLADPPPSPARSVAAAVASARVEPSSPTPDAAPLPGGLQVFVGNLHSHTSYSDGSGTPRQAYQHARHEGALDFLAITEHNHAAAEAGAGERADGLLIATNHALYNGSAAKSLLSAAKAATEPGSFVALYGQEFSTISSGNHVNVFDVDTVIEVENGRFDTLLRDWLPQHPDSLGQPALIQLNHPSRPRSAEEYGRDDFETEAAWVAALDAHAQLIELFNGPGTKDGERLEPHQFQASYFEYLNLGFHLGPSANQDNHYLTWGTLSPARTGVIAKDLSKQSILEALKARHVFATNDENLRFVAHAVVDGKRHEMGDIIAPPPEGTEFAIRYVLQDADEPNAQYTIQVLTDVVGGDDAASRIEQQKIVGNTNGGQIDGLVYTGGRQYFLLRIFQDHEHGPSDKLFTAPIWFEEPEVAPPVADMSAFVAAKSSGIFHTSGECRFAKRIKAANRVAGAEAAQGREPHEPCPQ